MTPVYMPFTYLAKPAARLLAGLVGPVVVYQPIGSDVPSDLTALSTEGLITIRIPMTDDDDRLRAALNEFTQWARMNPGRSTAGAGFISSRQGEVPHFDETAINRIRSEIRRYGTDPDTGGIDPREAAFSARLFLAVAQMNDLATDNLDGDLRNFQALEQGFVESLGVDAAATFSQHSIGGSVWREDPGARQTGQRIRAWATLAAADDELPGWMVTTSRAVVETLVENHGDDLGLETLAVIRRSVAGSDPTPLFPAVLAELAGRETLASADLAPFEALGTGGDDGPSVTLTLLAVRDRSPAAVIGGMASTTPADLGRKASSQPVRQTLILLVES